MDRKAKNGDLIKVHYTGRLEDGKKFDTSVGRSPLVFTIGENEVIPGFEDGIIGMAIGEMKTISIAPDHAYGLYNEDLVIEMPVEYFPDDISPEIGMPLKIIDDDSHEVPVVVTGIFEESIRLDANHPLAGKTLVFDIELLDIT
ncbi:MAG TPA: peptidylprolyl isomerase [Deltaproteobacteria bacterium]|nr:peptidylprolyl isomerase [Deltaproteobacteria bacterium]